MLTIRRAADHDEEKNDGDGDGLVGVGCEDSDTAPAFGDDVDDGDDHDFISFAGLGEGSVRTDMNYQRMLEEKCLL